MVYDTQASEECSYRRQWAEIIEEVQAVDALKHATLKDLAFIAKGQQINYRILAKRACKFPVYRSYIYYHLNARLEVDTPVPAGHVATGLHAATVGQLPTGLSSSALPGSSSAAKTIVDKVIGLPLELQHMVVNWMDLNTVEKFASAHPQARTVVRTNLYYQNLKRYAYSTFAALTRESNTCSWSLEAMYHVLTKNSVCAGCGGFGGFLFLPTLQRVCQGCAQSEDMFSPINSRVAKQQCNLTHAQAKSITMWTAKYHYSSGRLSAAHILISRDAALRAGGQPAPNPVVHSNKESSDRRLAVVAWPFLDKKKFVVDHGLACAKCYHDKNLHARWERDWQFNTPCRRCLQDRARGLGAWRNGATLPAWQERGCALALAPRKLFDRQTFNAHVQQCGISPLWSQRNAWTRYVGLQSHTHRIS